MGWKTTLLSCFRGEKKVKNSESDGEPLSCELSDPRNKALLPKQKSGCRTVFIIGDTGVQKSTADISCRPTSSQHLPAGEECTTKSSDSSNDREIIEDNDQLFLETIGSKILATAAAKSSSEGSSDDDSCNSAETVIQVTTTTTASYPEISRGLHSITVSAEDDTEWSNGVPFTERDCHQQRPQLSAARKRKVTGISCGTNPLTKRSVGTVQLQSASVQSPENSEAAAAVIDKNCIYGSSSVFTTSSYNVQLPQVVVPSLQHHAEEFWQLLRALTGQLGPMLNPSGPNVTRPHNWETDGCICRYLFPPMNSSDRNDLSSRYSIQHFDSTPTPVEIRQLPQPQKPFLE